jgi:hypothetical protein
MLMPKVGLTSDQKSHSIFDTENFKMKTGQKTRVVILNDEFDVEWVHWVDEFGYAICQGDYNTMMKDGSDPHCKFCQVADKGGVKSARRKFAVLLVVYRTNSKGQVLTPVSVDVQPWVFGDDKFNDLYNKKEQWGDLKQHDLSIECLVEQFQRFSMNVLPEAIWLQNDEIKTLVVTSYKESFAMYGKDLRRLLGRDITDPEKLAEIINDANGEGPVPDYASVGEINSMFADAPALSAVSVVEVDFAELMKDTAAPVEVETVVMGEDSETLSAVTTDPLGSSTGTAIGETLDFDELLT